MKLEKQVVSLELAQKMKELGFEQKVLFWWDREEEGVIFGGDKFEPQNDYTPHRYIAAYTVAELGEILQWKNNGHYLNEVKTCRQDFAQWVCGYQKPEMIDGKSYMNNGTPREGINAFIAKEQANARAKMLIYLAENKLIDPAHITKSKLGS